MANQETTHKALFLLIAEIAQPPSSPVILSGVCCFKNSTRTRVRCLFQRDSKWKISLCSIEEGDDEDALGSILSRFTISCGISLCIC